MNRLVSRVYNNLVLTFILLSVISISNNNILLTNTPLERSRRGRNSLRKLLVCLQPV